MGNYVNEQIVMQYYIDQINADSITFLQGKEEAKTTIKKMVKELMEAGNMNEKIMVACKLWKKLFEESMSTISRNKQGYDKLFKYFDAYVEFEELIFASDSFYRDHTLHCIWVYFLGEYIKKNEEFEPLFVDSKQIEITLSALCETQERYGFLDEKSERRLRKVLDFLHGIYENTDAIDCVAALTHDLGYPIKKIEKISKSVQKVLPYFAINNFDDFTFEYSNVQQEFITNFIHTICHGVGVNLNNEDFTVEEARQFNELLSKIFEFNENGSAIGINHEGVTNLDANLFAPFKGSCEIVAEKVPNKGLRQFFLNDFENYQHGIMSAYILAKNIPAFMGVAEQNTAELDTSKAGVRETCLSMILAAISSHTCEGLKIQSIDTEFFLTLVDELEEFSRISRASQNREYVKEFCETELGMDEEGWLCVDFIFKNQDLDNLDPEIAFKGRCKRFLTLFNIPDLSPNLKIRLRCIGQLATDNNTYTLEIAQHHAVIKINDEMQNIPKYLKAPQFYTTEEYKNL